MSRRRLVEWWVTAVNGVGDNVDRKHLQALAKERLKDARALLGRKRWAGAYYLSGYVVECALKSCLLKYLGESAAVFGNPDYLKDLAKCWTHDLVRLVSLAGLEAEFGVARGANAALEANWGTVKDWKETSRDELRTEPEAKAIYEAVSHKSDGVFQWIRTRW
jgi:HEPN domain-containing protein